MESYGSQQPPLGIDDQPVTQRLKTRGLQEGYSQGCLTEISMSINMAPLTTPCLTRPAALRESLWVMHQTIHPRSHPSLHRGAPQLHSLCPLHEALDKTPHLGIAPVSTHLIPPPQAMLSNSSTCFLCTPHWGSLYLIFQWVPAVGAEGMGLECKPLGEAGRDTLGVGPSCDV